MTEEYDVEYDVGESFERFFSMKYATMYCHNASSIS